MKSEEVSKLIRQVAIIGNGVYILWILRNAVDNGFRGTLIQIFASLGLIWLLGLNIVLLRKKKD